MGKEAGLLLTAQTPAGTRPVQVLVPTTLMTAPSCEALLHIAPACQDTGKAAVAVKTV